MTIGRHRQRSPTFANLRDARGRWGPWRWGAGRGAEGAKGEALGYHQRRRAVQWPAASSRDEGGRGEFWHIVRCQLANAGPRKTPRSVSLALFLSLSPSSPSFGSHSVSVFLTDIISVFLSFVRRARAGVHALSLLPRPTRCRPARQNPQNIHTASRGLSASFSGRARERWGRCSLRERKRKVWRKDRERERERERVASRRVFVPCSRSYTLRMPPEILDRPKKSEECGRECSHADCVMRINITQTVSCLPLHFPPFFLLRSLFIIGPVSPWYPPEFPRRLCRAGRATVEREVYRARPCESSYRESIRDGPCPSLLTYRQRERHLPYRSSRENRLANSREWYTSVLCARVYIVKRMQRKRVVRSSCAAGKSPDGKSRGRARVHAWFHILCCRACARFAIYALFVSRDCTVDKIAHLDCVDEI